MGVLHVQSERRGEWEVKELLVLGADVPRSSKDAVFLLWLTRFVNTGFHSTRNWN